MKVDSDDEFHSDGEDWSRPVEDITSVAPHSASEKGGSADKQLSRAVHSVQVSGDPLLRSKHGHQRTIIHIDIDCFYAQVEMLRNPELRDKPLGIQQKYIVVTCNYVARSRGVTKLMGIKEAREKCPDLVLVCGEDLTHYREMSYRISEFLQQYTPRVERLGFDENFLDVSEMVEQRFALQDFTDNVKGFLYGEDHGQPSAPCVCGCHLRLSVGSQIAADIREALHLELGITCCAGVAHNKLLSKLVAGAHKPNQQTTLYPEQVPQLLASFKKARQIPGIGWNTARKLSEAGIHSVTDLQECDMAALRRECGASAATIRQLSHGVDDSPVVTYSLPQTISDEDSFKKCSTVSQAQQKVEELLSSLLDRLVEDGRTPHTFRLTVRRLEGPKYSNRESRQCPIPAHFFHRFGKGNLSAAHGHLTRLAMKLFEKLVDVKQPFHLTLINVAFAKLEQVTRNISSFFSPQGQKSHTTANEIIDSENGENRATHNLERLDKEDEGASSHIEIPNVENESLGGIKVKSHQDRANSSVSGTEVLDTKTSLLGFFRKKHTSGSSRSESANDISEKAVSTDFSIKEDGRNKRVNERPKCREFNQNERMNSIVNKTNYPVEQCPNITDLYLDKSKSSDYSKECANRESSISPAVMMDDSEANGEATSTSLPSGCAHLPEGIDPEVFVQLPPDVQQEIIGEVRSTRSGVHRPTLNTPGRRNGRGKRQRETLAEKPSGQSPCETHPESEKTAIKNPSKVFSETSIESISIHKSPFKKRKRLFIPQNVKPMHDTNRDSNNNKSDRKSVTVFDSLEYASVAGEDNPAPSARSDLFQNHADLNDNVNQHNLHDENSYNSSENVEAFEDVYDETHEPSTDGYSAAVVEPCPENVTYMSAADNVLPGFAASTGSEDAAAKCSANEAKICSSDVSQSYSNVTINSTADGGHGSSDIAPVSPVRQSDSQFRCVTGPAPTVPPDMDEEVFRALPVEIQAELSLQWQFQNIRDKRPVAQKGTVPKRKEQSLPKSATKKSSKNMTLLNFFRNKNK